MKTDELIAALALEPGLGATPQPSRRIALWSLAGGLAAAAVTLAVLGPRPDLAELGGLANFLGKAGYSLALSATGLWLLDRLGRPGAAVGRAAAAFILVVLGGLAATGVELAMTPPSARMDQMMGRSAMICPPAILTLSLFALVPALLAARRLAPPRPAAAGAAAGLLAGGLAATAYGLHCAETTVSFLVIWYGLGVLASSALGALLGARLLRW